MNEFILNMKLIDWIYIIDGRGTPIVGFESHKLGNGDIKNALLSNLLTGLKTIASGIDPNEIKAIKLSNKKFCMIKEDQENYTFIFKTNKETDSKDIEPYINEIKQLFTQKYLKLLTNKPESEKIKIFKLLKEDIKHVVDFEKSNIKELLE
jgi:hypothetical protein